MRDSTTRSRLAMLVATTAAAGLMTGCLTMPGSKSDDKSASSAPAPAATPAAAPAPAGPKIGPGMNARGEVVDSSKIEAGYGQKVKGINDYEGEITGKPAAGSKFTKLQIGMSSGQVRSLIGEPTDQGAYITGKAFIPFFWGSDRYRFEAVYKGQGRLIFAGSAGFDSNAHLIWIIHNPNEPGFR